MTKTMRQRIDKQTLVITVALLLVLLVMLTGLTGCGSEKAGRGGMDEITSYE